VAAGYPASPSTVKFVGNRLVGNIVGLVLIGSTSRVPETGDQLDVVVSNNDLSENNRVAGVGISGAVSQSTVRGNIITGNAVHALGAAVFYHGDTAARGSVYLANEDDHLTRM
jgi:hypothetical protein